MPLEKTRKKLEKNSQIGFELILMVLRVILYGLDRKVGRNRIE